MIGLDRNDLYGNPRDREEEERARRFCQDCGQAGFPMVTINGRRTCIHCIGDRDEDDET